MDEWSPVTIGSLVAPEWGFTKAEANTPAGFLDKASAEEFAETHLKDDGIEHKIVKGRGIDMDGDESLLGKPYGWIILWKEDSDKEVTELA